MRSRVRQSQRQDWKLMRESLRAFFAVFVCLSAMSSVGNYYGRIIAAEPETAGDVEGPQAPDTPTKPKKDLPPKVKKADEACRIALEANFEAFNYEKLAEFMGTISKASGSRQQFQELEQEASRLFEQHDIYIRIAHYEGFWLHKDRLLARVVQHTSSKNPEFSLFRERSALLPRFEYAEYIQEFLYDERARKWLVGAIISTPRQVPDPAEQPLPLLTDEDRVALYDRYWKKGASARMR